MCFGGVAFQPSSRHYIYANVLRHIFSPKFDPATFLILVPRFCQIPSNLLRREEIDFQPMAPLNSPSQPLMFLRECAPTRWSQNSWHFSRDALMERGNFPPNFHEADLASPLRVSCHQLASACSWMRASSRDSVFWRLCLWLSLLGNIFPWARRLSRF